ncbi:MAG: hypothetical protein GY913_04985 [Proteobacteria bacterium]|nr:hypothetical protein [Pseudomonadota bacterium]MCP4916257.1 hypothetical protein [Pseudomonadota bacterium]
MTIPILLALAGCTKDPPAEDSTPEGDADTDTDADTDWDADSTVCGTVSLRDSCAMPDTVNLWTVLPEHTACDDSSIFNDTGIGDSWVDWRDTLADAPTVSAEGRFQAQLAAGDYAVRSFESCYGCTAFTVTDEGCAQVELEMYEPSYADAPNIYLYPEEVTGIRVRVAAPDRITVSDPTYPRGGWSTLAWPDGRLITDEGTHDYLFYETALPGDIYQRTEGWCVDGEQAQLSIEDAMQLYGFLEPEIEDFSNFWDPVFPQAGQVTVFPQSERLPGLRIDPRPDELLRVWFVVEPGCHAVVEPAIEEAVREGFHASEWGVVLESGLRPDLAPPVVLY